MSFDFIAAASLLQSHTELHEAFDFNKITMFIELVRLVKHIISQYQHHGIESAPERLLLFIHLFLRDALDIQDEMCKLSWSIFRDLAWNFHFSLEDDSALRTKHISTLLMYGLESNIGVFFFSV